MLKNKQEKTKFWRISTLEDVANRLYQKLNFKNLQEVIRYEQN